MDIRAFYERYDKDTSGIFSQKEIMDLQQGHFGKDFVESDPDTQRAVLQKMDNYARIQLFHAVSQLYQHAGEVSKEMCAQAYLRIAACSIVNTRPCNTIEDLIKNTMMMINNNVSFVNNVPENELPSRDAAQWSGARAFAQGNFNGCVEAAKIFYELYNEVIAQKGNPNLGQCRYLSSFDQTKAPLMNRTDSPAGHALVEVPYGNGVIYVDATQCRQMQKYYVQLEDLDRPLDIDPARKGVIISPDRSMCDLYIEKVGDQYRITTYDGRDGGVFNGTCLESKTFPDLKAVNRYLSLLSLPLSFADFGGKGIFRDVNNGIFVMGEDTYQLFSGPDRYTVFTTEKAASEATREEIRQYRKRTAPKK
jgi:hypothetical protein